jgi:hypothetical protein
MQGTGNRNVKQKQRMVQMTEIKVKNQESAGKNKECK